MKEAGPSDQYFLVNARYPLMFIRLWQDVGARVSHTASLLASFFFGAKHGIGKQLPPETRQHPSGNARAYTKKVGGCVTGSVVTGR